MNRISRAATMIGQGMIRMSAAMPTLSLLGGFGILLEPVPAEQAAPRKPL
jgi:hypothetical protein